MSRQSQSQVSSQNHSQRTRDLIDLKKQALNYFMLNADITHKVEDSLNSLFYESPYDAYGYLVRINTLIIYLCFMLFTPNFNLKLSSQNILPSFQSNHL